MGGGGAAPSQCVLCLCVWGGLLVWVYGVFVWGRGQHVGLRAGQSWVGQRAGQGWVGQSCVGKGWVGHDKGGEVLTQFPACTP